MKVKGESESESEREQERELEREARARAREIGTERAREGGEGKRDGGRERAIEIEM